MIKVKETDFKSLLIFKVRFGNSHLLSSPSDDDRVQRFHLRTDYAFKMSTLQKGSTLKHDFVDTTPMPADVPHVDELGATSAPLKSAAFFLGAYCKEYNGALACHLYPRSNLIEHRVLLHFRVSRGFHALQE